MPPPQPPDGRRPAPTWLQAAASTDDSFLESYRRLNNFASADVVQAHHQNNQEGSEEGGAIASTQPLDYGQLRLKLLTASHPPTSSGPGTPNPPPPSYLVQRQTLLNAKFNLIASWAEDVAHKQEAGAAMRRALKAEETLMQELTPAPPPEALAMNEGPDKLKVHGVSRLSSCGSISCLSFACRRRDLLACGHGSGAVTLFQPDQNRALGKIDAHAGKVTDVGWSAHGNFLVTASEDKTCRVWVVASGVLEGKAGGEGEEVLSLTRQVAFRGLPSFASFPPATSHVLSGSHSEVVFLLSENPPPNLKSAVATLHAIDSLSGSIVQSLKVGSGHSEITSMCYRDDGCVLFVSLSDGTLVSVPFKAGDTTKPLGKPRKLTRSSYSDAVARGGKSLFKTGSGLTASLVGTTKKRLSFGRSGSGVGDGETKITESKDGKFPPLRSMRYKRLDSHLMTPLLVGTDKKGRLQMFQLKEVKSAARTAVTGAGKGGSGGLGGKGGGLLVAALREQFMKPADQLGHRCCCLATLSDAVATGTGDGAVSVYDTHDATSEGGKKTGVEGMHGGGIVAMEWSYDDELIVSGDANGDLCVWRAGLKEEEDEREEGAQTKARVAAAKAVEKKLMRGWE